MSTMLKALPAIALAVAAATSADARDMPRGASSPRLTGCESYGPGFHKVQGSDTCIRLSGSVGLDATIRSGGKWSSWGSNGKR